LLSPDFPEDDISEARSISLSAAFTKQPLDLITFQQHQALLRTELAEDGVRNNSDGTVEVGIAIFESPHQAARAVGIGDLDIIIGAVRKTGCRAMVRRTE
jgi:hypothetical protein